MQDSVLNHLLQRLKANSEWKYQINIRDWQTDFLRFYDSQTNYNISKQNISVYVSVYKNKKSFGFSIDQPTVKLLDKAVDNAESLIDGLPEDPDFVDVETDLSIKEASTKQNNIILVPLEKKISILKDIAAAADKLGFDIFGTFICNYQHDRILNSNKIDKEQWNSPIYFEVKAVKRTNQVTVLHTFGGESFDKFKLDDFITQLNQKMTFAQNEVTDVEPGKYDVILAPRCIAELMAYLSGGMSARSYDQKSSYFEDKLQQKVFPDYINITDDPDDKD
ncbi:MAG: metallopeptidase TldD-related protein, partial [Candidatus Cloacimonadaceae bacterium]